jgi:hypothetical protein
VGKNVCNVSVLTWIVSLFFVLFCCKESKIAQSPLPIPKECEALFPKKEINFDFSKDSTAFMECYTRYNGKKNIKCDESEFNEYSVCAVIHPKIYGFPRECLNFAKQKDSTAYYACCKKNNACWDKITSGGGVYAIKQLEYEWVNPDRQYPVHSIEDYKNSPAIRQKDVRDIPWVKARMDSICGGVNVKHKDSKDSIICSVFGY